LSGKAQQFVFESFQFWATQPMKRRYQSGLTKVAHWAPYLSVFV
jgi:hypothetical protein